MFARYVLDLFGYVPTIYRCLPSICKIRTGYSPDVRLIRKTVFIVEKNEA